MRNKIWYTYDEIEPQKGWSTDMCCDGDEPQKHYAGWDTSDTTGRVLRDPIYTQTARADKSRDRETGGRQEPGKEEWEHLLYEWGAFFGGTENVLEWDRASGTPACTSTECHWTAPF